MFGGLEFGMGLLTDCEGMWRRPWRGLFCGRLISEQGRVLFLHSTVSFYG